MPASSAPPPYESAVNQDGRPALNVTNPQGQTQRATSADQPGNLRRMQSSDSVSSVSTAGEYGGTLDDDERRSLDDAGRELPKGWVRCFDPKNEHHFYVDERTKRSTWIHPYDDPEFLQSLPDTHPAHPSSAQAQAIRKRTEEEEAMMKKRKGEKDQDHPAKGRNVVSDGSKSGEDEDRNWFQRQKDKLVGTPEERAKAKAERKRVNAERVKQQKEAEAAYLKRRREIIEQQMKDPNLRARYAASGYSAPSGRYSTSGGMMSPYGYGE